MFKYSQNKCFYLMSEPYQLNNNSYCSLPSYKKDQITDDSELLLTLYDSLQYLGPGLRECPQPLTAVQVRSPLTPLRLG